MSASRKLLINNSESDILFTSVVNEFGAYVLEATLGIPKNLILAWQEFIVEISA